MPKVLIGVDLGGTRIRAARFDLELNMQVRKETLTLDEEGYERTLERILKLIEEVQPEKDQDLIGIGISAPGPLNPHTGVIVHPPNLVGWRNVPLGDIVNERFGVPVFVGNDANVACLAEVARGSAQGYRHAIYITVSTGIGSGVIIDGRMLLGREGLAAEIGHIPLVIDGQRVSSLENEASGTAIAEKAVERLKNGEPSMIRDLVDGDIDRVGAKTVGDAAGRGDELALQLIQDAGRIVGLGVVTMLHLFNPEIVVIGGGVTNVGDALFDPIWASVRQHALTKAYWEELKIVTPDLGEDVSIVGAAALVLAQGGREKLGDVENLA